MANLQRFQLNRSGIRSILKSAEAKAELERRAKAVASTAGEGFEWDSMIGVSRARATVKTATNAARRAEAKDKKLTRSIDAARR